jgi:hypothetical protein
MTFFARTFLKWLPLCVGVTFICLLVYAAVQQNYRQDLNDPQIQMAEDTAMYLESTTSPRDVPEIISAYDQDGGPIDFGTSLAPWIAILDPNGTVRQVTTTAGVESETSGVLEYPFAPTGPVYQNPSIPIGVLQAAANNTGKDSDLPFENSVTWQPEAGVRQAIVVVAIPEGMGPYAGDFVVAGRNMGEVEDRETRLEDMVGLAWIATIATTFAAQGIAEYLL